MPNFDVSKEWTILIPPNVPGTQKGGAELSRAVDLLRRQARVSMDPPLLQDASRTSPGDSVPIIVLNVESETGNRNGFSWRLGQDRLEIYGAGGRGLCNGIFDFLSTLGLRWPRPGRNTLGDRKGGGALSPILPPPDRIRPWDYPLKETKRFRPANADLQKRRRLVLDGALSPKSLENWIIWAARNQIDGVVFPLRNMTGPIARLTGNPGHIRETLLTLAADYALDIELGGWALSLLLPRRFFLSKPELFRMEQGKRVKKINFCATNPDTLAILKSEAAGLFQAHPETGVYHFWPDRGYERTWCSCPSCRAFSPEELNRIAVNSAADVLGELYPAARLSYYENSGEQIDIQPRPNMFTVTKLPGEAGAEGEGLFWTGGPSETGEP